MIVISTVVNFTDVVLTLSGHLPSLSGSGELLGAEE